jgi:transposase
MATIQKRKSRGYTYWYIVESRRVNGKPRPITLAYLGTAANLLNRLGSTNDFTLKSYSHGDTAALLNAADELGVVDIINRHVPKLEKSDKPPIREGLTVGASFLLAAIGRACSPTSKLGWYDWCKETSLEYSLKRSFKKLDSGHFWDQMNCLPVEKIAKIEADLVEKISHQYQLSMDSLLFDTTNFFTFIDSANVRCDIPQRGHNKQKRIDLRQIGMALLVTRKDQFPLFHKTYRGNKNDSTIFKEIFGDLTKRLRQITKDLTEITIVFDKGNNSKENFKLIDEEPDLHYVGGLVASYFVDLINTANKNFQTVKIDDEDIPAFRVQTDVWGKQRTCVVTISKQLLEGQIKGIHQHLNKKYKELDALKQQLNNPKARKIFIRDELEKRLNKIIKGQFINLILKYKIVETKEARLDFTYHVDEDDFDKLKKNVLGRKITVTNRHAWSTEEILKAYRSQSKVEYAFRSMKNPHHMAIRPQFHWTDQKIEVHILICIIGYLLTIAVYKKARSVGYKRNVDNFMDDLRSIRLASIFEKKERPAKGKIKVTFQLEQVPLALQPIVELLGITNQNLRPKVNFSVYN